MRVPAVNGEPLRCTVSVGISATVYSYPEWELASQQADEALYRAKSGGRNQWIRFDPSLDKRPIGAPLPAA